jgi:NAD(P)-dependent dehydrogenase (short-subunit alcohol dehydrogenase family)
MSNAANILERIHVSRADVRSESDLRALMDQARNVGGQFTSLVVCAGRAWRGDALETSPTEWDECLELNLKAPFLAARAALPHLKQVDNANIVFVSSIWAITATRRRLAYSVAKAGLAALTRNLAVDHGPDGVRINAVAPGYIDTELLQRSLREVSAGEDRMPQILARHPLKRIGTTADVAETVAFLAGPGATFITGQLIVVDGGVTSQFGLADLWED